VNNSKFDEWIKKILATEAKEISCSECLDLLPEHVDVEISGGLRREYAVKLEKHLYQCQACRDEYVVLRDLVRLEADGKDPLSGE